MKAYTGRPDDDRLTPYDGDKWTDAAAPRADRSARDLVRRGMADHMERKAEAHKAYQRIQAEQSQLIEAVLRIMGCLHERRFAAAYEGILDAIGLPGLMHTAADGGLMSAARMLDLAVRVLELDGRVR